MPSPRVDEARQNAEVPSRLKRSVRGVAATVGGWRQVWEGAKRIAWLRTGVGSECALRPY